MVGPDDQRPCAGLLRTYQRIVAHHHPSLVHSWPLLNGWNLICSRYKGWDVVVFKDAGHTSMCASNGVADVPESVIGFDQINDQNREIVRSRVEAYFRIDARDCVVLYPPGDDSDAGLAPEYKAMLLRHENAMGVGAMKLFLSHKGLDKPKVREFKNTLQLLGFSPWLDEDAMPAGTSLERGILKGFEDSCAAIFFVTTNYKDEGYLETEIDYAIAQKRKKGNKFSIVTLVFGEGDAKGTVPELLRPYVWKEPKSDLQALDEILKAIPIKIGSVDWR